MRTVIQLSLSVVFMALTSAPARADLIIYDMFGAVGELNMEGSNPLISLGISTTLLLLAGGLAATRIRRRQRD